jgi:hypothetical protein
MTDETLERALNAKRLAGEIACINLDTGEVAVYDDIALQVNGMPDGWQIIEEVSTRDWIVALRNAMRR